MEIPAPLKPSHGDRTGCGRTHMRGGDMRQLREASKAKGRHRNAEHPGNPGASRGRGAACPPGTTATQPPVCRPCGAGPRGPSTDTSTELPESIFCQMSQHHLSRPEKAWGDPATEAAAAAHTHTRPPTHCPPEGSQLPSERGHPGQRPRHSPQGPLDNFHTGWGTSTCVPG